MQMVFHQESTGRRQFACLVFRQQRPHIFTSMNGFNSSGRAILHLFVQMLPYTLAGSLHDFRSRLLGARRGQGLIQLRIGIVFVTHYRLPLIIAK